MNAFAVTLDIMLRGEAFCSVAIRIVAGEGLCMLKSMLPICRIN